MSRLLGAFHLEEPLRRRLEGGLATFTTCAGLILLSRSILDGRAGQLALGALDLGVRRNGYGSQVDSFEADLEVPELGDRPFRGVFIRAPVIEQTGASVEVLARFGGAPVMVRQGSHIALTFHPEMTGDDRIHRLFLDCLERTSSEDAA